MNGDRWRCFTAALLLRLCCWAWAKGGFKLLLPAAAAGHHPWTKALPEATWPLDPDRANWSVIGMGYQHLQGNQNFSKNTKKDVGIFSMVERVKTICRSRHPCT